MRNNLLRANARSVISGAVTGRGVLVANQDAAQALLRFEIHAYNGGKLKLQPPLPVVFDLSTTTATDRTPLLWAHQQTEVVGHAENIKITPQTIEAIGVLSGSSLRVEEIRANAKNGYPWQVSVGIEPGEYQLVEPGQTVIVNGQTFTGALYVCRNNQLREISFVSIGADAQTYARLLASLNGGSPMTFEEWLKSLGFDPAAMPADEIAFAQRIYDAMQSATNAQNATADQIQTAATHAVVSLRSGIATLRAARTTGNGATNNNATNNNPNNATGNNGATNNGATDMASLIQSNIAALRVESNRIATINAAAQRFGNPVVNGEPLALQLIRDGVEARTAETQLEIAHLRTARPTQTTGYRINAGGSGNGVDTMQLLSAALAQAGRLPNLERHFSEQVLQQAHTRYRGRLSLQQTLLEAAIASGQYQGDWNVRANLHEVLRAAFSTQSLPGILSNNVNKFLMAGFMAVDQSWREFVRINSVNDFKEVSTYRGVGSYTFQEIGATSKIPSGTDSETTYTNRAKTYARGLTLTREAIINDDLSYLTGKPVELGRGGGLALITAIYTEFLDNAAFFSVGNKNVSSGALSISSLNAMLAVFRKQTDEAGEYIMATPAILLVPVELEATANTLYNDINRSGGDTGTTESNPHARKYKPVVSPHLSDSRFTGHSTTAHYLLANPADIPVQEVVFLDGVEAPQVETAEADFMTLGVQMRGVFDFGTKKQEFRAGVRSTGA